MRNSHKSRTHQQDAEAMHALIRYKGYEVAPSAQRLPNGLYAANLTIGTPSLAQAPSQAATASNSTPSNASNRSDSSTTADSLRSAPRAALVSFDALDYFFDERHALAYACRWARMWIDERRRCV